MQKNRIKRIVELSEYKIVYILMQRIALFHIRIGEWKLFDNGFERKR